MRLEDDPLDCENCGELTHDEIETIENVPQIDPETFAMGPDATDVFLCAGCKDVIGVR
ncbi:hypothetical protein [Haloarchaeobius sp. TZWWS8]|uniref:hypothetical protein n=1 Tax=Haloarchaeobius sp. TZWWS8 TaxID=3446121 RepID=UPI003EBC44AA